MLSFLRNGLSEVIFRPFGVKFETNLRLGAVGWKAVVDAQSFVQIALERLVASGVLDIPWMLALRTEFHIVTACWWLRVNYCVLMTTCYSALRAVGDCVLVRRGGGMSSPRRGIGSHEGFRLALMLPRLAMNDVLGHRTRRVLRWLHRCQCFCNTR